MTTEQDLDTLSQIAIDTSNYGEIRKKYKTLLRQYPKHEVIPNIVNLLGNYGIEHTKKCLSAVRDMACFIFLGDTGLLQHCIKTSQTDVMLSGMHLFKTLVSVEDLQEALQHSILWPILCKKQLNRGILWMLNCNVIPDLEYVHGNTLRCIRTWCITNDKYIDILCADPRFSNDTDLHVLNHFNQGIWGVKAAVSNENNLGIAQQFIHDDTFADLEEIYERYRDFLGDVALHSIMPLLGGTKRKR